MKKLHEFKLPKEEEVEETFTETDDKGQEKTVTTKIKKYVDKNFYLKKPNRRLFDEAELYYAVKLSEGIKAGLLTRALLQKRFANDGGILSDPERESWNDLYTEVFDKQVKLQALSLKTKEERNSKENEEYDELTLWLKEARKDIQEFEMGQQSLYDQTAENRARNKTILWWVLHLAHKEEEGKCSPFFGEGSYEEKIKVYDLIEEEEEEWDQEVISKFFYFVSFWYVSKTNSKEEFVEMLKYAEQQEVEDAENLSSEEESPSEEQLTEAKEHVEKTKAVAEDKPKEEKKPKAEKEKPKQKELKDKKEEEPKKKQNDLPKEEKKPLVIGKKDSKEEKQ